ncbi:MAG TPA: ABC transporter permease subunit [Clostridia bacterium]|nr:ABC transporter permease subunit [Clostridia bacterium]
MSLKKTFYERRWVSRLFFLGLFALVWAGTARFSGISPLLLPPPGRVLVALWTNLIAGTLLPQALFSLGLILAALLISAALALILGVAGEMSPFLLRMIDAVSAMAHPLPGLALLPLVVIWFGTGTPAVLAVIVHACLWPLLISFQSGMRDAPPLYAEIGRNLSMSRFSVAIRILLPAAASQIVSGLRIGWARAWRALISAEMVFGAVGKLGGLGWFLFKRRVMMDTAGLFAGILTVALIGMAVEELIFRYVEKGMEKRAS